MRPSELNAPLPSYDCGNRLIDALGFAEREAIGARIHVVTLVSGAVTHDTGVPYNWVIFPIDCVLSVVAILEDGQGCEVGTIGNEGASGIAVAFGAPVLRTTICQVAGQAGRMRVEAFLEAFDRFSMFRDVTMSSEHARSFFIEQLVVCNTIHTIAKRCARWLLSLADRKTADTYALTHEYLSLMLGVRRPSVTLAERQLQELGAITYRHGIVRIIDRELLESLACECYRTTADNFHRSIDASRAPQTPAFTALAAKFTVPFREAIDYNRVRMVRNATHGTPTSTRFLEKLLVATDGSESGERAVAFALALAKAHASTIDFCDAVDLNGALLSCCSTQGESALMMPLVGELEDNGASVVGAARALAAAAGIVSSSEIPNGRSVAAILDCANDHRFDAIVVGTAGKAGFERIFSGSTADGVVRRSAIPVFVVPPGASTNGPPFKNVLIALDDSDPGDAALGFAMRIAASERARLTIGSVVETSRLSLGEDYYVYDPKITLRELHDAADSLVSVASDHAKDRGIDCERSVVDGMPADAILAMASEKSVDVIVVGTHGRRGLRRWFLGSVAEAVMRRSTVPVIVVRSVVDRAVSAKQSRMRDFAGD